MGNLVAIVGRPNVGKSTLFNRLTKTRQAIVNEQAGTTRDRQYGKSEWLGREFSVVDTGGWVVNSDDVFEEEIRKQVMLAVEEADVILFVVDVMKEHIAVAEANRLGIPVFGIVDTNSNPNDIDFVIPANDDATKSIEVILTAVCEAIKEGLEERKVEKADEEAAAAQAAGEAPAPKERRQRVRKAAPKAEAEKVATAEAPAAE